MNNDIEAFNKLVDNLKRVGYKVVKRKPSKSSPYWSAEFNGYGVVGGFCEENGTSYKQIDGALSADNEACFDKWSKCPLTVFLSYDFDELHKHLQHLGSMEGYEISNSYKYLNNNPWPRDVV